MSKAAHFARRHFEIRKISRLQPQTVARQKHKGTAFELVEFAWTELHVDRQRAWTDIATPEAAPFPMRSPDNVNAQQGQGVMLLQQAALPRCRDLPQEFTALSRASNRRTKDCFVLLVVPENLAHVDRRLNRFTLQRPPWTRQRYLLRCRIQQQEQIQGLLTISVS